MAMKITVDEAETLASLERADAYLCQTSYGAFRDFHMQDCVLYRSMADMVKALKGDSDPSLGAWNSGRNLTKAEADDAAKRIARAVPNVKASGRGYYGDSADAKKHWVEVEAPMYKVWPLNFGEYAPDTAVSVYLVGGKLLTKPEFAARMKELVSKK